MNGFVFGKGVVFARGLIYSMGDDYRDILHNNHIHTFGWKEYEHPKVKGTVKLICFRKKNINKFHRALDKLDKRNSLKYGKNYHEECDIVMHAILDDMKKEAKKYEDL